MDKPDFPKINGAERRFTAPGALTRQATGEDEESRTLVGHAAVFDVWTEIFPGFEERVAPEAFDNALREGQDVRALFNHNPDFPLARTTNDTLRLSTDNVGLLAEIDLADTSKARDVGESVRRGDVSQMSFGFRTVKDEWENVDGGRVMRRTLTQVDLIDVSPVTFAAYGSTDIAARAVEEYRTALRAFEDEERAEAEAAEATRLANFNNLQMENLKRRVMR